MHSKSPAQVLIRWNLQKRVVCIPKSTKEHRVKENSEVEENKGHGSVILLLGRNFHIDWVEILALI